MDVLAQKCCCDMRNKIVVFTLDILCFWLFKNTTGMKCFTEYFRLVFAGKQNFFNQWIFWNTICMQSSNRRRGKEISKFKRKFVTLCCFFELSMRKIWWLYWKIADLRPPLGICPQLLHVHFLRHCFPLNQNGYYILHKTPGLGRIINPFASLQMISVRSSWSNRTFNTLNVFVSKVVYPS